MGKGRNNRKNRVTRSGAYLEIMEYPKYYKVVYDIDFASLSSKFNYDYINSRVTYWIVYSQNKVIGKQYNGKLYISNNPTEDIIKLWERKGLVKKVPIQEAVLI